MWIKLSLFLLSLEKKVARAEKTGKPIKQKEHGKVVHYDFKTGKKINKDYAALQQHLDKPRSQAPPRPTLSKLVGSVVTNTKNIVGNSYNNTVGYGIAKAQNFKSTRHLKKDPSTNKYMVALVPGLFQNEGSQHKLARQVRKSGHIPYHIKPNNGKPTSKRVKLMANQFDDLETKTKSNPFKVISGHSDGASLGISFVQGYDGMRRVSKYKVAAVQARAPSVHGFKKTRTIGQKALIPFAPNDNVNGSLAARKGAVSNAKKQPYAPVHVVAGEYDGLVTPPDAVYSPKKGQEKVKHYVMKGKDSTHFGTAGGNKKVNNQFVNHIDDIVKNHKSEMKKDSGKVLYMPAANKPAPYKKAA